MLTLEAEDLGWESGVPYEVEWSAGKKKIDDSTGEIVDTSTSNDHAIVNYLPCHGASAIRVSRNPYNSNSYFYKEDGTFLRKITEHTAIENPFVITVPRNAYFFRTWYRNTVSELNNTNITPYLFPTLTENTQIALNTKYVMAYNLADSSNGESLLGNCYGMKKLQTSLWGRSFIYFYNASKTKINESIRQNSATLIEIPEGAYYLSVMPNGQGNANNPWIEFRE